MATTEYDDYRGALTMTEQELATSLGRVIPFAAGVELDENDVARMVFEDLERQRR